MKSIGDYISVRQNQILQINTMKRRLKGEWKGWAQRRALGVVLGTFRKKTRVQKLVGERF